MAFRAALDGIHARAKRLYVFFEHQAVGLVIIHHQDAGLGEVERAGRERAGLAFCLARLFFELDIKPELTANARLAFQPDLSAHHFDQLAGDGQPQAGAAVLARRGAIHLREALEDGGLPFRRDADAGILHREAHLHLLVRLFERFGADDNLALVGEFDRVADEVDQHLPQAARVAAQVGGDIGMDEADHLKSLFLGAAWPACRPHPQQRCGG